jgi:hypothetical protein
MNEREQLLAKKGIEKAKRSGAVKTVKKPKRERGRPKLAKVETRFVEPLFFGSVELCPETLKEVLGDPSQRHWVADQIELVLTEENFAERFGDGGGLNEQIERTRRWLEWRTESPEYLIAEALQNDNPTRFSLLSIYLLLGSCDVVILRGFLKDLPVEIVDETEDDRFIIPNPPENYMTTNRAAYILGIMACNPPKDDQPLHLALANMLIDAEGGAGVDRRQKDLSKGIKVILKEFGFSEKYFTRKKRQ